VFKPLPYDDESIRADAGYMPLQFAMQLKTAVDGYNSGRTYCLQARSDKEIRDAMASLAAAMERARSSNNQPCIERWQGAVRAFYMSFPFQLLTAILIVAVGNRPRTSLKP
jgi:hypothetical protein